MTEVRRSKRLAGSAMPTAKDSPVKRTKKGIPAKKGAKKAADADDENVGKTNDAAVAVPEDKKEPEGETHAVDAETEMANTAAEDKGPSKTLKVGDVVPNVALKNEDDVEVNVHDLVKEKGAVFFMFPRADTPGCTKQACGFRDEYEKFKAAGYNVFALSGDSPKALNKWKVKKELPYKLLSDPAHALIAPFGSSKPGKKVQRSHVIVATGGAVVDIQGQVSPLDSVDKSVAFVTKT